MERTVKIYLLDAARLEPVAARCLPLLTPSRRNAVAQYRNQPARLRSIAAGLLLYQVLGVQEDAELIYNEFGKPSLSAGEPQFSLSHAGRYAALAVAPFPVGVDIEPMKETYPQILREYFRPEELNWLDQAPGGERFYTLWTRLESALKAEGMGFACGNRAFSILDGSPLFFKNKAYEGHMIACAAAENFELQSTEITRDLLRA